MHLLGLESGLRGGEGGNFFLESPLSIKMHLPGLGGNDEAARIQCVGVSSVATGAGGFGYFKLVWKHVCLIWAFQASVETFDSFGNLNSVHTPTASP